jgi:hypothetical protein
MPENNPCQAGRHRPGSARHRLQIARRSLRVPLVLAVATGLSLGAASAVNAGTAGAASVAKPMLFGAAGSSKAMIQKNESIMGSKVVGARVYKNWGETLFTSDQIWARDTGHVLFVSIRTAQSGHNMQWSAIASAQPGSTLYSQMVSQGQQIKAFGARVYVAFNHEPEASGARSMGTSAQYVAAFRKWVTVVRAQGASNAKFVFDATAYGFSRTGPGSTATYYPGDAYVDAIAADGYNWAGCQGGGSGGWRELSQVIEAQRQFGLQHPTKALMLWEFGSAEDKSQPGHKAQWLRNARALFKQSAYSQYTTILSWEGRAHTANDACHFDYLSSSTATAAWKEFGSDPVYKGTNGM